MPTNSILDFAVQVEQQLNVQVHANVYNCVALLKCCGLISAYYLGIFERIKREIQNRIMGKGLGIIGSGLVRYYRHYSRARAIRSF